jgi:outer membrane protein
MPKNLRPLLVVVLGWAIATSAGAQDAVPLTLDDAVEQALERNRGLEAARAEAREARAAYDQMRAGRLPSVEARGSYTRLSTAPEAEFAVPGVDTTFTLFPIPLNQVHSEVGVQMPLFTGSRLTNQRRAAEQLARAATLLADQEAADVAFEVRTAYWRVQQATALREAIEAVLAAVEEHVRRVETLVAEGAALPLDLLAARTRRSEVLLERVEAESAIRVAGLQLNRLIGLPLETRVVPATPPAAELAVDLDALISQAVEARPQLAAMAANVRALEADLAAKRGAWLPEVAAFGRLVYARPNPIFFLEQDEFRAHLEGGLTARWTLFDGGARPAVRRQAEARLDAAAARLADAQELVAVEVRRRYLELQRAAEAASVAAQHLTEAEEAFRVVRVQFAEGVALAAQVLDAEQALRAATARQTQAAGEIAIAHAAVLNVTGEVW